MAYPTTNTAELPLGQQARSLTRSPGDEADPAVPRWTPLMRPSLYVNWRASSPKKRARGYEGAELKAAAPAC